MPDTTSYKKLKGTSYFSASELYTGSDHLLLSNSNFFSEEYLRFYYNDIQAIISRKTLTGKILNICFLSFLIVFLIPAILLSGGWSVFFFTWAIVFLLLLIINFLKGPTSICFIQTQVQTARLSAIKRTRGAEKALARLLTLIQGNQGELDRERYQNAIAKKPSNTSVYDPEISLKHEGGRYHQTLFSLLAFSTVIIVLELFYSNILLSFLMGAANLTIAVFLIVALKKQNKSDLYKSIKILTWSICGYLGIKYVSSYMLQILATFQNPGVAYNQYELAKKAAAISPLDYSLLLAVYIFFICFSIGVGVTGLILTGIFRKENKVKQYAAAGKEPITPGLEHE